MDFFEAQEFFKKLYPDKLVILDFDDSCIRQIECIYTDGKLHPMNHVEYNRVKVTPQGMPSQYVPIQSHRAVVGVSTLKQKISTDELYFHPDTIASFNELKGTPQYDLKMDAYIHLTGLSKLDIESKLV